MPSAISFALNFLEMFHLLLLNHYLPFMWFSAFGSCLILIITLFESLFIIYVIFRVWFMLNVNNHII